MSIHTLDYHETIEADEEECWKFFSDPRNLAKITPTHLNFQILSDLPDEMYEGMCIEYRVHPIAGIPMTWLTEITHVDRLRYFCDEQRVGPYRVWHHEHFFQSTGDGKIRMRDLVHYVLPFGIFGDVAHSSMVKKQLEGIFDYRKKVIHDFFKPASVLV